VLVQLLAVPEGAENARFAKILCKALAPVASDAAAAAAEAGPSAARALCILVELVVQERCTSVGDADQRRIGMLNKTESRTVLRLQQKLDVLGGSDEDVEADHPAIAEIQGRRLDARSRAEAAATLLAPALVHGGRKASGGRGAKRGRARTARRAPSRDAESSDEAASADEAEMEAQFYEEQAPSGENEENAPANVEPRKGGRGRAARRTSKATAERLAATREAFAELDALLESTDEEGDGDAFADDALADIGNVAA
jgi:hypothetical protein